jgi:hypothetical protein
MGMLIVGIMIYAASAVAGALTQVPNQCGHLMAPRAGELRKPMEQHHQRAGPLVDDVHAQTVGLDEAEHRGWMLDEVSLRTR